MYVCRTIHLKHLTAEQKTVLRKLMAAAGMVYSAALKNYLDNPLLGVWANVKLLRSSSGSQILGSQLTRGIVNAAHADILKFKSVKRKAYRLGYSEFRDGNYARRIKPPKANSVYPLICNEAFQSGNKVSIPMTDIKITLYKQIKDKQIKRFTLCESSGEFYATVAYKVDDPPERRQNSRALAIDLGVANFAACVDSNGKSFILDGKYLKHVIYCHMLAKKQIDSDKAKQDIKHITKREAKNTRIRKERINSYLNRCAAYIIKYCTENRIDNIVVGYSTAFHNFDIGKENNLMFSQMPYTRFCKKLEHECKKHDIQFWRQDESYTSQASFYDGDSMPGTLTRTSQKFSGKRIKRGLYRASDGRTLNADINGAANILSKFYTYTYPENCNSVPPDIRVLRDIGIAQPIRVRP